MLIQLATGSHLLNFLFNAFKTQAGAFNVDPLDRSRSTTTYGVRCEDNLTSSLTKTFQMLLKRFSSFSSSQLHRKNEPKCSIQFGIFLNKFGLSRLSIK